LKFVIGLLSTETKDEAQLRVR